MTKTWQTKKKILKLIEKKAKTPGEISNELNLAPSTVSEHLEELQNMGAVQQIDNPFIRKWKYFKANPEFNVQALAGVKTVSRLPQIGIGLAVILGIIVLLAYGPFAFGAGNLVSFQLTDPPRVPVGTNALIVSYSSLQAHVSGNGNQTGWVSASGSGTLNLMTLINTTQVIGTGKIAANATIDMVRFTITSAKITINGTTYNVTLPSGQLTAHVTGQKSNANSILLDLSPVVTTIYTNNSTVFVLVPSVKAVVVGGASAHFNIGEKHELTDDEQNELNVATPEIGISSASLVVSGNTTRLTVVVKNNANKTVDLRHVILFGIPSVLVKEEGNASVGANVVIADVDRMPPLLNGGGYANVFGSVAAAITGTNGNGHGNGGSDAGVGVGSGGNEDMGMGIEIGQGMQVINGVHVNVIGNGSIGTNVNAAMRFHLNASENHELNDLVRVGAEVRTLQVLNFLVTTNGTLVLPFAGSGGCGCGGMLCAQPVNAMPCISPETDILHTRGFGYTLSPGASATLTFSSNVVFANGHLRIIPVVGSKYELVVQGDEGAHAETNVTVVSG